MVFHACERGSSTITIVEIPARSQKSNSIVLMPCTLAYHPPICMWMQCANLHMTLMTGHITSDIDSRQRSVSNIVY